jgi:hypothetical protein
MVSFSKQGKERVNVLDLGKNVGDAGFVVGCCLGCRSLVVGLVFLGLSDCLIPNGKRWRRFWLRFGTMLERLGETGRYFLPAAIALRIAWFAKRNWIVEPVDS